MVVRLGSTPSRPLCNGSYLETPSWSERIEQNKRPSVRAFGVCGWTLGS